MQPIATAAIRSAFAAVGVNVRVRHFGAKARICRCDMQPFDRAQADRVTAGLGMTNAAGQPGGQINQAHEVFAYYPGAIVRARIAA